jgi:hypothetical protein
MNLETPWQRIAVFGAWLAFLAVLAVSGAWMVSSLSDANAKSLGDWTDAHSAGIWGFLIGAIPATATYFFGQAKGKAAGKTEAFNSAVATATGQDTGDDAANALAQEARAHGLRLSVTPPSERPQRA